MSLGSFTPKSEQMLCNTTFACQIEFNSDCIANLQGIVVLSAEQAKNC